MSIFTEIAIYVPMLLCGIVLLIYWEKNPGSVEVPAAWGTAIWRAVPRILPALLIGFPVAQLLTLPARQRQASETSEARGALQQVLTNQGMNRSEVEEYTHRKYPALFSTADRNGGRWAHDLMASLPERAEDAAHLQNANRSLIGQMRLRLQPILLLVTTTMDSRIEPLRGSGIVKEYRKDDRDIIEEGQRTNFQPRTAHFTKDFAIDVVVQPAKFEYGKLVNEPWIALREIYPSGGEVILQISLSPQRIVITPRTKKYTSVRSYSTDAEEPIGDTELQRAITEPIEEAISRGAVWARQDGSRK